MHTLVDGTETNALVPLEFVNVIRITTIDPTSHCNIGGFVAAINEPNRASTAHVVESFIWMLLVLSALSIVTSTNVPRTSSVLTHSGNNASRKETADGNVMLVELSTARKFAVAN